MMDRRSFFRIDVDLPAELKLDSGDFLTVRVLNISAGGVQIQCDAVSSGIIVPHGNYLCPSGRPIGLDLIFAPEGQDLHLRCHVVFVRRLSHDEYRIGLRYANPLQPDFLKIEQILLSRIPRP